jgi:uncharacterized damage-inducible protein DinB
MGRTIISLIEAEYRRYKSLGEGALEQLDAQELIADAEGGNSIATIVWHIAGNLESRFTDFLETDGEKAWRDRESEFERRLATPAEVRAKWEEGWGVVLNTLDQLADADLSATITIRGIPLTVDEALFRSLAHTSYHVGQIVYIAKGLRASSWNYLTIPPGGSAAYNADPALEKAADHAQALERPQSGSMDG